MTEYTNCKCCGKRMIAIEGREYGPVCARKLAGQVQLDSQALVSGKVLRKKKAPEKVGVCRVCGCTDLMPCPGGCSWVEPDLCSQCAAEKDGLILECPVCHTQAEYGGYPPNPQVSTVLCLSCGYAGIGAAFKRVRVQQHKQRSAVIV